MRKDVEGGGDIAAVGDDAGRRAACADEWKHFLAARIGEPSGGMGVDAGVAVEGEQMRIVAAAAFADGALEVTGETLGEPRGRAAAGKQHVGDFVEIRSGARGHAVDGEMNGPAASRGDTRGAAQHEAQAGAWAEASELLQFADTARNERGERAGSLGGEGASFVAHGDAAAADGC